jgi:hypothetical protein
MNHRNKAGPGFQLHLLLVFIHFIVRSRQFLGKIVLLAGHNLSGKSFTMIAQEVSGHVVLCIPL